MASIATPNPEIDISPVVDPVALSARTKDMTDILATRIVLYSFVAAVLLAIGGFVVVAVYLFQYLHHAFDAFSKDSMTQLAAMDQGQLQTILLARAGLWKFILQSCGIISGVAFGFLGFGLFLLGAKGDMDAAFDDSQHKVQLTRMAPGSFVILIGAILIGVCSIHKVELAFDPATVTKVQKPVSGGGDAQASPGPHPAPVKPVDSNDPATNPNASMFPKSESETPTPQPPAGQPAGSASRPGR